MKGGFPASKALVQRQSAFLKRISNIAYYRTEVSLSTVPMKKMG